MIQFNENTLTVGLFGKNTEKVLSEIASIKINHLINQKSGEEKFLLECNFMSYNLDKYLLNVMLSDEVADLEKVKQIEVTADFELNAISGLKKIRDQIVSILGLTEGTDFNLTAQADWKHADMNARITLPVYIAVENANLRALIDMVDAKVQEGTAFKYKDGDNFILYFATVDPNHLPILEDPEVADSILIEQK